MYFTWDNRPLQFRFKITKWIGYVSLNIEDNQSTSNKDLDENERYRYLNSNNHVFDSRKEMLRVRDKKENHLFKSECSTQTI